VVYRESARQSQGPEAPSEVLLRVDVSGQRGANGAHGHHGEHGGWAGQGGGDGGSASRAYPGEHGGVIVVRLSEPRPGAVHVSGERVGPDGSRTSIDEQRDVGDLGFIDLVAMGGSGGRGGDGGPGGSGATGSAGADATRYSSGGSGGAGGHGGDGGDGTSGADGGVGGRIVVRVHERDTHLLMLVRRNVGGGAAGAAGHNGSGGYGGSGGSGGDSYSWSETSHYTDSNGNRQSRTSWHRNPGGVSGPAGHRGRSGGADLHSGKNGQDGRYAIEVEDDAGAVKTYPERYDLRLISFQHLSENEDGIYEPGERVRVFDLLVRNVGGMPTPAHRKTLLHLRSDVLVHPEDETLELPRSLPAAHEITLTGKSLHFRIGDWAPTTPGEGLSIGQTVRHGAYIPAVERAFSAYETEGSVALGRFDVSFPVEVSEIKCLRSMAAGQASAFRFSVRSRSGRELGRDGDLGRAVRFKLFFRNSELGDGPIWATDADGRELTLGAGHVRELPRLGPGDEPDYEYTIGIADGATEYSAAEVWVGLELGHVERPLEARPIQYRAHRIRVARRYRHRPGSNVVLVVNHRTERDVLDAWERTAKVLGFELDVLDLSYEGRIDLLGERDDGPPLVERIDNGTVIVLNEIVGTRAGETPAADFFDLDQLRDATMRGLDVAFVGEPVSLEAMLPALAVEPTARFEEEAELVEAIRGASGPIDLELVLHRIGFWFEEPTELLVAERALALSKRLTALFPARRFVVVHELGVDKTHEGYVVRRWRAGTLRVMSTLDSTSGRVLEAQVGKEDRVSPDYPASLGNLTTLLLARGFDERVELMLSRVGSGGDTAGVRAIVDAILVELATEQQAVLEERFRSGLNAESLLESLPLMRSFVEQAEAAGLHVDPKSPLGRELCRLVGRLRFFVQAQVRWWEWPLLYLRRSIMLRRATMDLTERLVDALVVATADPERVVVDRQEAEDQIDAVDRELRETYSDERRAYAIDLLLSPIAGEWLTAHAERRSTPEERVLSRAEHDELVAERAQLRDIRSILEEASADELEALSRPGREDETRMRVASTEEVAAEVEAAAASGESRDAREA